MVVKAQCLFSSCDVLSGFPIPSWKYKHLCQPVWWLRNLTQAGNHWTYYTYLLWWLRFKSRSPWKRRWRTQTRAMTPYFINIYCITKANSRLSALYISLMKKLHVTFRNASGSTRYWSASAMLNDPVRTSPLYRELSFSLSLPFSSVMLPFTHIVLSVLPPVSSLSPPPIASYLLAMLNFMMSK